MFGVESLHGSARALATVGAVLAEAVALYLVYGAATWLVGETVRDALEGEGA